MKTIDISTGTEKAYFYISNYNDVYDSPEQIEKEGFAVAGKVIMDSLFIGSLDNQRTAALETWLNS